MRDFQGWWYTHLRCHEVCLYATIYIWKHCIWSFVDKLIDKRLLPMILLVLLCVMKTHAFALHLCWIKFYYLIDWAQEVKCWRDSLKLISWFYLNTMEMQLILSSTQAYICLSLLNKSRELDYFKGNFNKKISNLLDCGLISKIYVFIFQEDSKQFYFYIINAAIQQKYNSLSFKTKIIVVQNKLP